MRTVFQTSAISVAAVATVMANTAPAQPTGTRIGHNATAEDAPVALAMIAKCITERQPKQMAILLHTLPGSEEEQRGRGQLETDMSFCLQSEKIDFTGKAVRFKVRALRDPVSVWMARREDAAKPNAIPPAQGVPLWIAERLKKPQPGMTIDGTLWARQDFGHCVAVGAWDDARALLRSEPATLAEKAAIAKLIPVLGPCLDANLKIEMTSANIRTLVAEPIYHLLVDGVPSSSAAKQ